MIANSDADVPAPGESTSPHAGFVQISRVRRDKFTVLPGPHARRFESFSLPRVPVSLLAWCGTLAEMFRQKHSRCLGCILTLDPSAGRWTRAVVPPQSCEAGRVVMDAGALLAAELPSGCVVAGSSQSAVLRKPAEATTLVPNFDGLHVVDNVAGHRNEQQSAAPHCFVRAGGMIVPVGAELVVFDDWVGALRQHADRLTLD